MLRLPVRRSRDIITSCRVVNVVFVRAPAGVAVYADVTHDVEHVGDWECRVRWLKNLG